MPLSHQGKKLEEDFKKEYGKSRGKNIFFGYEHKHPELHLTKVSKEHPKIHY